jgi:hypothetical protein
LRLIEWTIKRHRDIDREEEKHGRTRTRGAASQ